MRRLLQRHLYLLDFTLASLGRRKGRNAALVLVYALLVFALASVLLFTQALRLEARELLAGAPELLVQRTVAGRHELLPEEWLGPLAGLRGVARARGRVWGYLYDPLSRASYTLVAPEGFAGGPGEAAIGPGVARLTGARVGGKLALPAPGGEVAYLTVREVLPAGTDLVSADLVLLREEELRPLLGVPAGRFTDAALSVRNPREVETVARKVAALLPGARPISRAELLRTYEAIFDWRSGLALLATLGAVLAFAVVAWDKASGLSADERRELGILKAIGWETRDVLAMKLWEGAVVSLSAFALGALAAYAHVFLAGAALLAPILRGWSTLPPGLHLTPHLDPYALATLLFFTAVPYAAATLTPCWRAATVDPDAVMRS